MVHEQHPRIQNHRPSRRLQGGSDEEESGFAAEDFPLTQVSPRTQTSNSGGPLKGRAHEHAALRGTRAEMGRTRGARELPLTVSIRLHPSSARSLMSLLPIALSAERHELRVAPTHRP